ncbi:hypothetical protein [Brevundimonas sp. Root1279]|uniref:hypothetical protein n=1 Tax=Brevundimonas sp. Root1279 TaxID=1736443 RepID=UPI0007015BFB|nr:hypothetical protein [Brevundimonas sp. Root1279]KQW82582.1 hypothetical protein ASC65_10215 [Brevundimonas sp. Root1279]
MIALALTLLVAEPEPARAELCRAHMNAMIAEAMKETGRVAGPSWFIRDWWTARLPEAGAPGALTAEQRAALEASMPARKAADPDKHRAELGSCVNEAMDAGAVP